MRHWVSDYSDSELMLGVASPWLTDAKKAELEAEIIHRMYEREQELAEINAS